MPGEDAMRGAAADWIAALHQPRLYLPQGDVPLLGEPLLDEGAMRFDPARVAVTPREAWQPPCQRIALDVLTPEWAAAARQLMSISIAATTLSCRLCESVRAIHTGLLHPAKSLNQNGAHDGIPREPKRLKTGGNLEMKPDLTQMGARQKHPAFLLHCERAASKAFYIVLGEFVMRRSKSPASLVFTGMTALILSGCASTPEPVIGAAATQPMPALGQSNYSFTRSQTYLLRPSDRVSVNVFREPDLSLEAVQVGVGGDISLPMLGSIPVAGMTSKSLEQDITRRLAAVGLKAPMVSVNIVEYASHLVTVEGAVGTPGVYTFQPGSRLSSAIAMAGGPARTAKSEQVAVFREVEGGVSIAKFNYNMMSQGTMLDPVLEPGDRIVMGTDGLSVFWQDLLKALPAFGIFATAGLR